MGGQNSKAPSGVGYFSSDDVSHFKSLFNTVSRSDRGTLCSARDLQNHCEHVLDDWLALKLIQKFSLRNPKGGDSIISVPDFLTFLSALFCGTIEEKVKCVVVIASGGPKSDEATVLTQDELSQYARCIVESYLKSMEKTSNFHSWKGSPKVSADAVSDFADYLLLDLLYEGRQPKELLNATPQCSKFELEELVKGLSRAPLLLNLQASVFSECFSYNKSLYCVNLIPHCLHVKRAFTPEEFTILDMTNILFINSQLPVELRQEWRYLFSTAADGESFSKMLGAISQQGATVIIIKETSGRIFGAFADECWAVGPKFNGSEKCFLFHLSPKVLLYASTGYNQNFQYLNIQQQTLPNGLGMGGKLDYFGLWLDAEFGKGKCAPSCTTFATPQLSGSEHFRIEAVEVWGVGPPPAKEEGVRDPKSILDKDPEARAILDLMNKPAASDGYRDKKKIHEETEDDE